MRRRQLIRRGIWAAALATALVFTAQASRADEWYPGLPDPDSNTGASWAGAAQGGISYAKRAKQWFRSSEGMVTFTARTDLLSSSAESRDYTATGRAFMVSPKGAPANYGYMEQMTVRSVGFGLMPVEATVQVSQRRKGGYPVPLESTLSATDYYDPAAAGGVAKQVAHDTVVEDAFNIQIVKVRIDGVDLGLTGDCRTSTPAPVKMIGPGYTIHEPFRTTDYLAEWFRAQDPSTFFHPFYGGQLSGTMTIPPFTGCTTAAGDDLSALMTLSVSGPDNPVSARVGWPCGYEKEGVGWPLAPGESNPKLVPAVGDCHGTKTFDYPPRPAN